MGLRAGLQPRPPGCPELTAPLIIRCPDSVLSVLRDALSPIASWFPGGILLIPDELTYTPEETAMPLTRDTPPVLEAEALDMLSEWLCYPDPDEQWRSAADFIEFAANVVAGTGRPTTPAPLPPRFTAESVTVSTNYEEDVPYWATMDNGLEPPKPAGLFLTQDAAVQFADAMNRNTEPLR